MNTKMSINGEADNVGAVAAAQSTLAGHVIAEPSLVTFSVKAETLPLAAELLNV
jgi:hypothetical protein